MSDPIDSDSPPVERYYTYKEAAEILRLTYQSLRTILYNERPIRYRVRRANMRLLPESWIRQRLARRLQACQGRNPVSAK